MGPERFLKQCDVGIGCRERAPSIWTARDVPSDYFHHGDAPQGPSKEYLRVDVQIELGASMSRKFRFGHALRPDKFHWPGITRLSLAE